MTRTDDVRSILSGDATLGEVAARHGVTVDEVSQWLALYHSGVRAEARLARRRRLQVAGAVGVVSLFALGFVARQALAAGSCMQFLPAPLVTFCPDDPALAAEINGNFQGVLTIMNGRIGPTPGTLQSTSLEPGSPNATITVQGTAGGTTKFGGAVQLTPTTTTDNLACNGTTAGSLRVRSGALEVCSQGNWSTLSGHAVANNTVSCATIRAATPSAANGVYALSAGGYSFLAQCDMTNGGWTMIQAHTSDRTVESLYVADDSATYLPAAAVRALALAGSQVRFIDPNNGATATSSTNTQAITQLRTLATLNITDANTWSFSGNLTAGNFTAGCATTAVYPSMIHSSCNSGAAHVFPDTHTLRSSAAIRERSTVWVK